MKRKEFLEIAGCTVKRFDNMRLRDQMPFTPKPGGVSDDPEGKHADYSILDAFQLRIFLDAIENKGLPADTATYIAGNCIHHLRAASERVGQGGDELWVFYAHGRPFRFSDTGETMTPRRLGAGTLAELPAFVRDKLSPEETQFIALVNASVASLFVLVAALKADVIVEDADPVAHIWERDYATTDPVEKG